MAAENEQQFNAIAPQYSSYVGQDPFRMFLHYPAVVESLRDGPHQRVLDVGCGNGHLGEILSNAIGAHVIGYDVAPAQIEAASSREWKRGGQNSYIVGAPETFTSSEKFDAAVSVMVLPYAGNVEQLREFFISTQQLLPNCGKFVSVIFNPQFSAFNEVIGCRRFERLAGDEVRVCFLGQKGETTFTSLLRQFTSEEYDAAARFGGFAEVAFSELRPSPEGRSQLGDEFWQRCESCQPYAMLTVTR